MGFTDEVFPLGTHMCFVYDNEEERRKVIGKFLSAGMHSNEKVAYFADRATPDDVRSWLADVGVDLEAQEHTQRLTIGSAEKTYCPCGEFVPETMLSTLRRFYNDAQNQGYEATRASGEMSWALRGIPGSDRLIEYEALLNEVFTEYPVTAICQYDARLFSGAVIFDVLKVHPMMIVHGQIVRNPYYLRLNEYLGPAGNGTTQG